MSDESPETGFAQGSFTALAVMSTGIAITLFSILYFMFQLPNTKILISKMFPSFFSSDSNLKLNGLICISLIFGLSYYVLNYFIEIMSMY